MKTNLLLLCIFIGLFGVTYWSEEVFKKKPEYLANLGGKSLIQSAPITQIQTNGWKLLKEQNRWSIAGVDWPVNSSVVENFEKRLRNLKIFSEMKKNTEQEWQDALEIKYTQAGIDKNMILLGVSKVTGSMYFSHSDHPGKVLIGQYVGAVESIYTSESDKNLKKYLFIKKLFETKKEDFLELNLLKGITQDQITKIKVDNTRNRWFELDLLKGQTLPIPFLGIRLKNLTKQLMGLATFQKVIKHHSSGKLILSDKRSEVLLSTKDKTYKATLFLGLNGKYGNFFQVNGRNDVFEVELLEQNLFFSYVQMFWSKTFTYKVNFNEVKRIDFEIAKPNTNYFKFFIDDIDTFVVKSNNKNIQHIDKTRMNFLFNLLLNLTDFKEAKYVKLITKRDKKYQLSLKLFEKEFGLIIGPQKILVDDLSAGLQYIFENNTKQVQSGFFQKIFTVKNK